VLERAAAAGVERILVPGWDVASSEAALALAVRHAPQVQAAVGIHPHDSGRVDEAGWRRLEALAVDPGCVAIGEIGLDNHHHYSPPDAQREAFARQLSLAATSGRPVLVHDREAHAAVTDALLAWSGPPGRPVRGVLHAFSGGASMAQRLAAAGYLISFALPVAFRSAAGPRAAAAELPRDAFVVETDSPFLGPAPGTRNEPTTVLRVAAELARIRDVEVGELAGDVRLAYERLLAH
jgi:TatD DNase family protein